MRQSNVYPLKTSQGPSRFRGKNKQAFKKRLQIWCIFLMVAFLAFFVLRIMYHQHLMLQALHKHRDDVWEKITATETINKSLQGELLLLETFEYIERVARTEYGMVGPGELIFVPIKPLRRR